MLKELEIVEKKYELVIGLEVHAQLKTHSKLMSPSKNVYGQGPNTAVATVCTGMPGALPTLNKKAVEMAITTALALRCDVRPLSVFSRKHYFYPDLPKGYQISQYDRPYAENGRVEFFWNNEKCSIGLIRIHLEEDAGKNLHFDERGISLVDLNRSSVPLIEIVSLPDMRGPEEAGAYLRSLRRVLRYLDVCDGNLEEGNLRCDANISLRIRGVTTYGTRVELKNINSFRNLEKALVYEAQRQFQILEEGGKISQETRLWDASLNKSLSMRSKEEAADYRYMPEPDLLPLQIQDSELKELASKLPELPISRAERFIKDYERSAYDADVLTSSKDLADYFEQVTKTIKDPALASNFIQSAVLALIQDIENDLPKFYPNADALSDLLSRVKNSQISLGMAKEILEIMVKEKSSAEVIIQARGLSQVSDDGALQAIVDRVIAANPKQLAELRSGKDKLFGFFMGQCQKELQGKGNPGRLKELLEKTLKV